MISFRLRAKAITEAVITKNSKKWPSKSVRESKANGSGVSSRIAIAGQQRHQKRQAAIRNRRFSRTCMVTLQPLIGGIGYRDQKTVIVRRGQDRKPIMSRQCLVWLIDTGWRSMWCLRPASH